MSRDTASDGSWAGDRQPAMRLLIVDENETARLLLIRLLERSVLRSRKRPTAAGYRGLATMGATGHLYGHANAGHGRLRGHQTDQATSRAHTVIVASVRRL